MEVTHYLTANGIDLVQDWLDALEDLKARAIILRRIDRLRCGAFGDCKFCGEGVWELRIDSGPGYRIYYARQGATVILLLQGGSKATQDRDIPKAIACWKEARRRQA